MLFLITAIAGIALAIAMFAAIWYGTIFLIALGGWSRLAGRYADACDGANWQAPLLKCYIGRSRYGRIVRLAPRHDGLCLSVHSAFRPGHPSLFIPRAHLRLPASMQGAGRWNLVDVLVAPPGLPDTVILRLPADALRAWTA